MGQMDNVHRCEVVKRGDATWTANRGNWGELSRIQVGERRTKGLETDRRCFVGAAIFSSAQLSTEDDSGLAWSGQIGCSVKETNEVDQESWKLKTRCPLLRDTILKTTATF